MTRIESIFGTVMAVAILGIFAFVFFGEGSLSVARTSTPSTVDRSTKSVSVSLLGEEDEYIPPSTNCDCYNYAYDFARDGIKAGTVDYESQISICYERLGSMGAAAFERGFVDAVGEPGKPETRRRKSCPVREFQ